LRCLGFLMIFLGHAHPLHIALQSDIAGRSLLDKAGICVFLAGGVALELFFLSSGYLICTLLLRERQRTGTVSLPLFYMRRVLRIWPLYFFALLMAFLASRFIAHDHRVGYYLAYLFMIGNWAPVLKLAARAPFPVDHLWSISVEEQFYLLFGPAAKYAGRRALFWICIGAILLGLTVVAIAKVDLWRNSFSQFMFFAAGILIGLRYPAGVLPQWSAAKRLRLLLAAIVLLILNVALEVQAGLFSGHTHWILVLYYSVVVVGTCAILLSFLGIRRPFPRPMVFLGKISYGLYVFHLFAIDITPRVLWKMHLHFNRMSDWRMHITRDAVALGLTILLAVISFYAIELPFLKLKTRFTVVRSRAA